MGEGEESEDSVMIAIRFQKINPVFREPVYQTPGSAGFDLMALEDRVILPGERSRIPLGFALEVPYGYCLEIRPRSSMSLVGLDVHLGTVDSDYRGEVCAILSHKNSTPWRIKAGDRIAQGVIVAILQVDFRESYELSETKRGTGDFGSTGR